MNVAVDRAITECYATTETNCMIDIEKKHADNLVETFKPLQTVAPLHVKNR